MKFTLAMFGLFAALTVSGCGGDDEDDATADPASACKSITAEICSKFFGCFTEAEQQAAAALIGNNEADCRTKFEQNQCNEQMLKCDSGKTYSSAKASECLEQYKALSCSEVSGGTSPAACDAICQ